MKRFALSASLCALLACASRPAPEPVSDGRYVMGTVLEITLHGIDASRGHALLDRLFERATKFDALMSTYVADSDVNRINAHAGAEPQAVAAEVRDVVAQSIGYWRLTRGTFDVTVGPLVALWTDAAQRDVAPGADELARALERVGSDRITLSTEGVGLASEGMSLNLGGVAKGYALDEMLPLLADAGVNAALLNFGQSSTWALGAPEGTQGWRLLVRGPDGGFVGLITLRDRALSVSGSLGQSSTIAGREYGHILDPRSGRPLTRRRQAVIVSNDAALAEALSKALLVLEVGEGIGLIAALPDCEGLLVEGDGAIYATPGWNAATRFEKLASPR